jgi:large subunit ribosomal protein L7/L12
MADEMNPEVVATPEVEAEAPTAPAVAPVAEEKVEVPSKFKKLVEEVEGMTVLELSELVKVLEKKFGVSAAAVAVAGPAAAGAGDEEAKSTADVELTDSGASKIAVIKVVKEALALGLKEAKDLVDAAPSMLKTGMKKEDAAELAKKLTDAGAKVTLK